MKRRARASVVTILAIAALIGVVIVFLGSRGDNEQAVAIKFLSALAKGDAKAAAETSMLEGMDQAELEKKWAQSLEYNRHYRFIWRIRGSANPTPGEAIVKVTMRRNSTGSTYDEPFELRMVKSKGGDWVVDLDQLSRLMYPNLPR